MGLARDLDTRIEGLRTKFGEIGDTRLTVMAALTVADELAETGQRISAWRRNSPPCRTPRGFRRARRARPKRRSRPRSLPPPSASST